MPVHFTRALVLVLSLSVMATTAQAQQDAASERHIVSAEEALEMSRPSAGVGSASIVVHRGENITDRRLRFLLEMIYNDTGTTPIVVFGNLDSESVSVYVSGLTFRDEHGLAKQFGVREFGSLSADIKYVFDNDANIRNQLAGN